jgi:hypothetical protein
MSVGEAAMTPSTSLVAVCCSSASPRSRVRASTSSNRRTFFDGDDGLCECSEELDLFVGEWRYRPAGEHQHPDRLAFAHQGDGEQRSVAGLRLRFEIGIGRIGEYVGDLY